MVRTVKNKAEYEYLVELCAHNFQIGAILTKFAKKGWRLKSIIKDSALSGTQGFIIIFEKKLMND